MHYGHDKIIKDMTLKLTLIDQLTLIENFHTDETVADF